MKAYELVTGSADSYNFFSTTALRLILALWVDDGLAMCQDQALLTKMSSHLKSEFEVAVGDADVHVGLHITRYLPLRKLYSNRQRFTETFLSNKDGNTVSTPCDPHAPLS